MFIKKRLCRKCNNDFPLTIEYFCPRKTDKNGFNLYCKECINSEKREKRINKRKISNKGGFIPGIEGKRCTICKNSYPCTLDYFGKHKGNKSGLDTFCKECRRNRNLNNFYKASDKWKATHNRTKCIKQQRIKELKENSGGCLKCKENRYYLLDYHHIDPSTKLFQIAQGGSKGWEKVKNEIDKCILLCKNCHSEFHHFQRENNITLKEYLSK